jgi:hypothetical protein
VNKKTLVFLNLFSLLLSSCGSFQSQLTRTERAPAAIGQSCAGLMKEFFNDKVAPDTLASNLAAKVKIELNKEEIQDFLAEFENEKLSSADYKMTRSIMLFTRNDSDSRKILLREFHFQTKGGSTNDSNKVWSKFIAHRNKVEAHKNKLISKAINKSEILEAEDKGAIFEKLYYSCKAQVKGPPSAENIKQSKRLRYALMAGGMGSVVTTYSAVHWNEEKNEKWFKELYFVLGMGLVLNFIGGKLILGNPNLSPWKQKMPLTFLNNAINDVGVSGAYAFLFKSGDSELEKKFEALQNDPKAEEKLEELLAVAQEKGLILKHLTKTQEMFIDKSTNQSMKSSDFDHEVTLDDIDLEGSREQLMEVLAEKEYQENSGMLATGVPAVDRFSYHRIFNLMSVPTNIGLTILMQNQMCMTADPKKGFAKAVAIYMGAQIVMDSLYFKGRKEVINQ